MMKNYRIFLAILLFSVLINGLKADEDDPEEAENPEGAEGQEEGPGGEEQENDDENAGNEGKEQEGEKEGENQEGPEGNNEPGDENVDQPEKPESDDNEEKPQDDEDENAGGIEGNNPGKDKKKEDKEKVSKEGKGNNPKRKEKGGKTDEQKTKNGTRTDTNNGISPENNTTKQNTGQSGQQREKTNGQNNINPNLPYSPTVYPNGVPGQPQQQPNINPYPPIVNPPIYPVYPSQSDIPNQTNPPIYPQYPPISPPINKQQQQQLPYSPFGTNSLLEDDIDSDPFGFGITLTQQQYSPYSLPYQRYQNNPVPSTNNLGGFGNNEHHVPGQTFVPYEQRSQLPMIVRGSENNIDNTSNYGYQRTNSLGRGRRSDIYQEQENQSPILSTVCFKPTNGTRDNSAWIQNTTNIINSNPLYKSIPSISNQLVNNGGIPEICTVLQQNIETNGFQQGRLIRKKRNIGK
ncbi:hypothetical protein Mgra_00005044 [Meloidogyne graminicola]|uniref:Uncharacterized protein n=1 Tax=Meloidogyne graminicola TaxID=189291 RepID=A0A8S9ZQF1_9BILA|nr:hypothetical protein Mgra_00005044 [Meloidogyne graminicola]